MLNITRKIPKFLLFFSPAKMWLADIHVNYQYENKAISPVLVDNKEDAYICDNYEDAEHVLKLIGKYNKKEWYILCVKMAN